MQYIGLAIMGLAAGLLSTMLGIGGGLLVVPMLVFLFTMPIKMATGTSLAYMVPIALAGAIQHGLTRNVDWRVALLAAPFGLIGTYVGKKAFESLAPAHLKLIFGALMLVVSIALITEAVKEMRAGPSPQDGQSLSALQAPRQNGSP
jgi:uncharacterized membrane protein YfcA